MSAQNQQQETIKKNIDIGVKQTVNTSVRKYLFKFNCKSTIVHENREKNVIYQKLANCL